MGLLTRIGRRWGRISYIVCHEVPWWFLHRFHPGHRHHVIRTGLRPGWHDTDVVMAWMIRKWLIDYFELEKPLERWQVVGSPDGEKWGRLIALYEEFKTINIFKIDRDELTEKLVEVVRLRGLMWT